MKKNNDHQTLLMQIQADKAKSSVLSNFESAAQSKIKRGNKFVGFPMRFGILSHLAKALARAKGEPKAVKASMEGRRDASAKCYDNQDLHLHRLKEIMHEHDLPKRKVWNIKLPRSQFKALFKPLSRDSSPISAYTVVQFPLKEEKELQWENTKIPEPERQYILTRITDFNKTQR